MTYLKYSLLLLPAFTFGVFSNISTMPWTFLLLPFLISKIRKEFFWASLFVGFYGVISLLILENGARLIIQSTVAIINATLVMPYVIKIDSQEFNKLLSILYAFCIATIIMGTLQTVSSTAVSATEFFFGRASGFTSGKGVPGLSTEPARSALDLMTVLVAIIYIHRKQERAPHFKYHKYVVVAVFLYLIIINKSNTSYLFIITYTFIYIFKNLGIKKVTKISLIVFMSGILFIQFSQYFEQVYAIQSAYKFLESSDKYQLFMQLGGHRVVGFETVVQNLSLFGYGLGGWEEIVSNYLNENYRIVKEIGFYRLNGLKPTPPMTFLGRFSLEIGLVGLVIYFYIILKNKKDQIYILIKEPESLFILFSLIFLSYGGSPVPFLCLGAILYSGRHKTLNFKLLKNSSYE